MKLQEIVFILALLAVVVVRAEPPWTVDDPGVTEYGKGIVYLTYLSEQTKFGNKNESLPSLAVTLGLSPSTELGMSLPFLKSTPATGETSSLGIGDYAFALKYQLWENSNGDALALSSQVSMPTGDSEKGFGSGAFEGSVALLPQIRMNLWKVVGQISAAQPLNKSGSTQWTIGSVISRDIGRNSFAGVQAYSIISPSSEEANEDFIFGIGGGTRFSRTGSAQFQLSKGFGSRVEWIAYSGVTLDFDSR